MLETDLLRMINDHAGTITPDHLLRHYATKYGILLDYDIETLDKDSQGYKDFYKAQTEIVDLIKTLDMAGLILKNDGKLILTDKARNIIEDSDKETFRNIDPNSFFEGNTFISKKLADHITSRYTFKTLIGSEEVYYYDKGLYVKNGREAIKRLCTNILQDKYTSKRYSETLSYIQGQTYIDPININENWLNLENGLLNPHTKEFIPHTPDVFSIVRIPITYDPKAKCQLWIEKLKDKTDKETYETLQEYFGYCYQSGQRHEKALLLYGPPKTMKSTVLYVLDQLLGKENYTSFTLQQINQDPFVRAYLFGKLANICPDITSHALNETGPFMTIVGGDSITAGKKNQHHTTFYPNAKLIFSCNVVPGTYNKNLAFYRRWILLNFNKQTPAQDVDPYLKDKLKAELPGILNWALDGLDRLEKNKKFSYTLTDEQVQDLYERNSDTINSFIFNIIDTENDEESLTKRETYKAYLKFCKKNELQPVNDVFFGRRFISITGCGTTRKGPRGEQIPAYQGVSWKIRNVKSENTLNSYDYDNEETTN